MADKELTEGMKLLEKRVSNLAGLILDMKYYAHDWSNSDKPEAVALLREVYSCIEDLIMHCVIIGGDEYNLMLSRLCFLAGVSYPISYQIPYDPHPRSRGSSMDGRII